jgi:hypothetical protein
VIGPTLSSEQIRNAPADVRRWIEREVMTSLGQQVAPENGSKVQGKHLAACSEGEITGILAQIQGVLPAVNVFFDFGRQGAVFGRPDIEAFRLLDIAHHTRLQNIGQVIACLDIINQAFGRGVWRSGREVLRAWPRRPLLHHARNPAKYPEGVEENRRQPATARLESRGAACSFGTRRCNHAQPSSRCRAAKSAGAEWR